MKTTNGYFIETSVIVDYLRGKKEVTSVVDSLEDVLVSGYVCLAELYEGIFRVRDAEKAEEAALLFFHGLDEVLSLDEAGARMFGKIRAGLKKTGTVIEDMDIMIAALCIAHGYSLITRNAKHFSRVPELVLYEWPSNLSHSKDTVPI